MADEVAIIAGLGNPGTQYRNNRHNAGFLVLDFLMEDLGASSSPRKKWDAEFYDAKFDGKQGTLPVYLMKPQTFMNRSGQSVGPAAQFYKVTPPRLLVIHDEIELPRGKVQLKKGGGHKGHNGIRDIIAKLGTADFYRLRIGLGRPEGRDVAGYSLSNFTPEEEQTLHDMAREAAKLTRQWLQGI
jgi:PTH1 family peptidyl-tRNA hydrolase